MLPSVFIVGAPKAGTTSLYHYLKQHPEVFFPETKELNFFSAPDILGQGLYYKTRIIRKLEAYETLYRDAGNAQIRGDASVSYLFYPAVPTKIKEMVPDARIIIMLRNPVERAYSHYLMDKKLGYVKASFEDIVSGRSTHKLQGLYYQQYVEVGLYADQVQRYLDSFGEKQVHIVLFEDFIKDPLTVFQKVSLFLEISDEYEPQLDKHNVFSHPGNKLLGGIYGSDFFRKPVKLLLPESWSERIRRLILSNRKKPSLSQEVREKLWKVYVSDVDKLSTILKRDMYDYWK
jgi:hypothetical protein